MVHADLVIPKIEFNYEGVFDFNELLSLIKDFLKSYNYDITEKRFTTKRKDNLKTINIRWSIDKKLDDYNKAVVDFRINLTDFKEMYVDDKKVVEGNLQVIALGIMARDYGEQWKTAPSKRFIRAVYDKYVAKPKLKKIDDSFINMVKDLMKEIKNYFNTK